ncbi:RHS repeat-associated core domain-containing protein [Brevibacillus dissolubilis]|uniref:RHS repeat-associated core domain-containing protein n=1 Tax=Brevibacillus dissolubilis TaxID=1844116 RepID=UPI0011160DD7|nr:RHS repeat-associated core domain-containing protein [Brevibacillus dissolubilis]
MDSIQYHDAGPVISYKYDATGRLSQINSTLTGLISYGYTTSSTGETVSVTYPNNTKVEQKFNPFGEITETAHSANSTVDWRETNTYDGFGNITAVNSTTKSYTLAYDKIDRVITENVPNAKKDYTYDSRGNRKSNTASSPLDLGAAAYSYDAKNRLKTFGNSTVKASYTYYPGELRATKTVNGQTTKYVYVNGNVVEELDANNQVKAQNVWGNQLVYRKVLAPTVNSGYYYPNSHGDIVKIKGAGGNTLNTYDYDIWGNIVSQQETMSNPFTYSGEMYDAETKMYYLRARYYDPSVGRFITEDTYKGQVDNPLSLNRYAYVVNNPLKYVDPSGHVYVIGGTTEKITMSDWWGFSQETRDMNVERYYKYGSGSVPHEVEMMIRGGFTDPTDMIPECWSG